MREIYKRALLSQALHDLRCRSRSLDDVAAAIVRNTSMSLDAARLIAAEQERQAERAGATVADAERRVQKYS